MKKKGPPPKSSPKLSRINDITAGSQRVRLLERLKLGPADTLILRREENILMPAARVKELRDRGHKIYRQLINLVDEQGRRHPRIALYSLTKLTTRRRSAVWTK